MYGYVGQILRIDLCEGRSWTEDLDEATTRKWVGGSGLGTNYLLEDIPAGTKWSDPENLLIFTSGPLGGCRYLQVLRDIRPCQARSVFKEYFS